MKSKIISSTLVILGFVLGATALSAIAAWTAPVSTPPNCTPGQPGCDAPIHVGASAQSKMGLLTLQSNLTDAFGLSVINGIKIVDDGALAGANNGKVLTSDANGIGTWQNASVSAGGPVFITPVTIDVGVAAVGTYNGAEIPDGARAVIVQAEYVYSWPYPGGSNIAAVLSIKKDSGSPEYYLINDRMRMTNGDVWGNSAQGIFPVTNTGSFIYDNSGSTMGMTLRVIGYIL